jgi:L-ascorbate metabolism protein UlaG (beta-lactamase superfamily)
MQRRKFVKKFVKGGAILAVVPSVVYFNSSSNSMPKTDKYTHNPELKNILPNELWPGTPVDQNGVFINHEHPFWPKFSDLLKWQMSTNPYKEEKKNDERRLEVTYHKTLKDVPDNSITWLGHACFLIKINGIIILIDPVFDTPGFFMNRYSDLPIEESEFVGIDYILISHDHRDHCSEDTIKLLAKQNPDVTWLCGLRLDTWINKWTGSEKIQAAGWYQQYDLKEEFLKVTFLPTRHWSRRGLNDVNATLWGAFMIEASEVKIYFGGDSGYGSHIADVNKIFGEVDFYIAGIGAFAPRWFMGPSHMHPEEVAQACIDLQPKNLIPMHFGTFNLSDEPLLEPAKLISEQKEEYEFPGNLILPKVGEPVRI